MDKQEIYARDGLFGVGTPKVSWTITYHKTSNKITVEWPDGFTRQKGVADPDAEAKFIGNRILHFMETGKFEGER